MWLKNIKLSKIWPLLAIALVPIVIQGQNKQDFFELRKKVKPKEARDNDLRAKKVDQKFEVSLANSTRIITIRPKEPVQKIWFVLIKNLSGQTVAMTEQSPESNVVYFDARILNESLYIIQTLSEGYEQHNLIHLN